MRHRWRLDVIRIQILYGFTHSVAIYDMFMDTKADWVPSNDGVNRATPLAVKVKRITGWYLAIMFTVIIALTAYRLATGYSVDDWWGLLEFLALYAYIFFPVVWMSLSTLFIDARAERRARRHTEPQLAEPQLTTAQVAEFQVADPPAPMGESLPAHPSAAQFQFRAAGN